ncbi:MAG: helix-turn-helix transcriptional regulator [Micropruina sp.]
MLGARRLERDAATLGRHLVTWRKLLGYTAAQVAERAGISAPTLTKIEHGDPGVRLGSLLAVIRVLGLTDKLLTGPTLRTRPRRASADRVLPKRVRR